MEAWWMSFSFRLSIYHSWFPGEYGWIRWPCWCHGCPRSFHTSLGFKKDGRVNLRCWKFDEIWILPSHMFRRPEILNETFNLWLASWVGGWFNRWLFFFFRFLFFSILGFFQGISNMCNLPTRNVYSTMCKMKRPKPHPYPKIIVSKWLVFRAERYTGMCFQLWFPFPKQTTNPPYPTIPMDGSGFQTQLPIPGSLHLQQGEMPGLEEGKCQVQRGEPEGEYWNRTPRTPVWLWNS